MGDGKEKRRERERERENELELRKTLLDMDCSLGSVKDPDN